MGDESAEGAAAYNAIAANVQKTQDDWRKNQAMAALTKQYGPTAGDPDDTAKVQQNYFAAQTDPLKVTALQQQGAAQTANIAQYGPGAGDPQGTATDVDTQQKQTQANQMAGYRAAQLLKSSAAPDGSVSPDAYDKIIAPNAAILGIDPAHVGPLKALLTQPGGAAHLDTISNALLGPTKVTGTPIVAQDAQGNSVLVNHDQYGRPISNTLPAGTQAVAATRANTGNFAAQTRAQQGLARLGIQQQNADTSTFRAGVTANNSTYGSADGTTLPGQGGGRITAIPPNGVPVAGPGGQPFDEASVKQFISGSFPGTQFTSTVRDPAHNAALPGAAPNSEHLYGQAADLVLPKGTSFQDFKDTLSEAGLPVTELTDVTPKNAAPGEGAHIHWAWGDAAKQQGGPPAAAAQPAAGQGQTFFDRLPPKGRSAAISQATQLTNQSSNLANTNKIIDQVASQISPYTAGTGSLLKDLPGTAQKDLQANLATLKAQGLTSWIQSLKNQQGQTGVGRVLQSEANAAMNLYGNMEQDQSAKQLAFHLTLFRQAVNNLATHARAGFTTMYGKSPEDVLGLPAANGGNGRQQPQYTPTQQATLKKYGL